jgi:predicted adenine nucleotide alpha hydrolase (AANH) superfamily ATPase
MNWEKIKSKCCFNTPVEYIYTSSIFNVQEYDKLYENQNNFCHKVWTDFYAQYKTDYNFLEDLNDIDLSKPLICLWFFKERSDQNAGPDINLAGKTLKYLPNTFLITESKDIKVIENKKKYIRRPLLQLDLELKTYKNILQKFR